MVWPSPANVPSAGCRPRAGSIRCGVVAGVAQGGAGIPNVKNDAHASVFMTLTDIRKDNLRATARPGGGSDRARLIPGLVQESVPGVRAGPAQRFLGVLADQGSQGARGREQSWSCQPNAADLGLKGIGLPHKGTHCSAGRTS